MHTNNFKINIKKLWKHFNTRRKYQLIILLFITIIASIAEVISVGAVFPFLSVITAPEKLFKLNSLHPYFSLFKISNIRDLLFVVTVLFSITIFLSGAMRILLLWFQTKLSNLIGADLSFVIYRNTLYQPYSVQITRNSSEIISGISSKANAIVNFAIMPIFTIISSTLIFILIFTTLVIFNPVVSILAISGFSFIYVVIIQFVKRRLKTDSERLSKELTTLVKVLQEGLGGIRDILIDGTQEVYCEIYKNADIPARKAQANISIISAAPRFIIESLGTILIALIAYYLTISSSAGNSTITILGGLAMGALRIMPVLQQLYVSWANIKGGEALFNDAIDLLEQELPSYVNEKFLPPIHFNDALYLNNLSFRYSEQSNLVLNNINLKIEKGSRIGIIGSTGSGKSTLLDVLMGLLNPTEGEFLVDGNVITLSNFRNWQMHLSHVPQMIYLSDSSIAENIAFGIKPSEIDYDRVLDAAKRAKISETIENLPNKYKTIVGERGVKLSGGQRQRIGIARALYKNAKVIILDEATSALDNSTEKEIMDSINQLGSDLTVLIVAHRLSTLKNCKKIIQIENGKILKIGTYQEIIANNLA